MLYFFYMQKPKLEVIIFKRDLIFHRPFEGVYKGKNVHFQLNEAIECISDSMRQLAKSTSKV